MLTVLNDPARPESSVFDRTVAEARYASGFYALEHDEFEHFRWMGLRGRIELDPKPGPGFAEFRVWSGFYDLRQRLTVETDGRSETFELPHGWWTVSVPVPAGCGAMALRADRQLPQSARPGDDRQLAVRVAAPRTHRDDARHRTVAGQLRNAVLNTREALEGRAELASTPTNLGIDLYGVCNVKPPCVYCEPLAKPVIGRVFCRTVAGQGTVSGRDAAFAGWLAGSDRHRRLGARDVGVHGASLPVMRASTREEMCRISFTSRSSSRLFSIHSR